MALAELSLGLSLLLRIGIRGRGHTGKEVHAETGFVSRGHPGQLRGGGWWRAGRGVAAKGGGEKEDQGTNWPGPNCVRFVSARTRIGALELKWGGSIGSQGKAGETTTVAQNDPERAVQYRGKSNRRQQRHGNSARRQRRLTEAALEAVSSAGGRAFPRYFSVFLLFLLFAFVEIKWPLGTRHAHSSRCHMQLALHSAAAYKNKVCATACCSDVVHDTVQRL